MDSGTRGDGFEEGWLGLAGWIAVLGGLKRSLWEVQCELQEVVLKRLGLLLMLAGDCRGKHGLGD